MTEKASPAVHTGAEAGGIPDALISGLADLLDDRWNDLYWMLARREETDTGRKAVPFE